MTTIKSWLYQLVVGSMVFYITTQIVTGIEMSGILTHWLMAFGVFFLANFMAPYVIKFLTLPKNILTYWLASGLASIGGIYVMSIFLPGIQIGETLIDPVSMGIISVNPYTLSSGMTMVLGGIVAGLLNAILFWLRHSAE